MENWETFIKTVVEKMGFSDFRMELHPEERRGAIFIYENQNLIQQNLPVLVESLNHVVQMASRKNEGEAIFIDVNNYRHDREHLIAELARAAAKRALATKEEVSLPIMNSYERRLVHMELAIHPEVKTESIGEGKERYVVVKPI